MKEELGGFAFLTKEQKDWVDIQIFMQRRKPFKMFQPPENSWRKKTYRLASAKRFEYFIVICIIINMITMSLRFYGAPKSFNFVLECFNYVFAVIFNLEAIIKISAWGWSYFLNRWNQFDFIIVIGTDLGILITILNLSNNFGGIATLFRAFRITRIVKLIKTSKDVRVLLETLIKILPSISNIGALVFLMFFIYSTLGMNFLHKNLASSNFYKLYKILVIFPHRFVKKSAPVPFF